MRGGLNYETQPKQNYGQDSSVLLRSNTIGENVVNQTKQTSRARRRFDNDWQEHSFISSSHLCSQSNELFVSHPLFMKVKLMDDLEDTKKDQRKFYLGIAHMKVDDQLFKMKHHETFVSPYFNSCYSDWIIQS